MPNVLTVVAEREIVRENDIQHRIREGNGVGRKYFEKSPPKFAVTAWRGAKTRFGVGFLNCLLFRLRLWLGILDLPTAGKRRRRCLTIAKPGAVRRMTTEDMCATKWPPAWGSVREVLGHPTHVSKVPVNGGLFSTMRRVDFTNVAARPVRDGRSPRKQDVGWELMRLLRLLKVLSMCVKGRGRWLSVIA